MKLAASLRRIWGLMYRHLALYRTSWPRVLELMYWPTLQLCIWGFTSQFFAARLGASPGAIAASMLLSSVLLWEIALRSQMGLTMSFMEEMWSRNLGHVFVSPLRPWELVAALVGMSMLRMSAGVLPATLLAYLLYSFNVFTIGPALMLFVPCLMVMGWAVALGVVALILRYGSGAEALAWSLLFGLTPFAAVFYPVAILPRAVQPVSLAVPASHVFEGMRAALKTGAVAWGHLGWAAALDMVWLGAAVLIFAAQFRAARVRGALITIGE
jgi:ABC-2 type transport system permease protein